MALLDRLIRDARKSMQAHHHIPMPAQRSMGRGAAVIQCATCLKGAYVVCKPQPNDIQIGGEAVAMDCNVATTKEGFAKVLDSIPRHVTEQPLWRFEEPDYAIYAVQGC